MLTSHIVIGLGYGDEGKGSWVDHLVRTHGHRYVVRFNGGAQAAHHVVTPEGITHCFAQFGSGSFVPGTATILSRFMLVDPETWLQEAGVLAKKGVHPEVLVSANAPIITPFNRLLNRIQETAREGARHGSCGFGIGLTQGDVERLGARALYARDLGAADLTEKLRWLHAEKLKVAQGVATPGAQELLSKLRQVDLEYYGELFRYFAARVRVVSDEEIGRIIRENEVVFEGAQGVLLDQHYGFFPHCTRSTCSFENAVTLLRDAGFGGSVQRVGLLRGYGTRHGAGPFITEDPSLQVPGCHNATNEWQGAFRLGWFDAVAARYALKVVGPVDTLAITNLDRMRHLDTIKVATHYRGHDERFFSPSGDVIDPLVPDDFDLRAERTGTMASIAPVYQEFGGWHGGSPEGVERYLQFLADLLAHPVHAWSEHIDHRKSYR